MTARTFAALGGGFYLALGILGFVPAVWERPATADALTIKVFYASIFGIFTTNIILSMIHLVLGLWGIMSANNKYSSVLFARSAAVVFLVMGIAGAIPVTEIKTVYGTTPLGGNNVVLHIVTAVIGLFFAFRPGYTLTQVGLKETLNPHAPAK